MLRSMVGIGLLCGLLIVATYEWTLPRIEMLKARALEEAIFKVVPGALTVESYVYDNEEFIKGELPGLERVFVGYDDTGSLAGFAVEASGQGYADLIRILYGYDPETEQIVGFYVLESKETPGLGDKIEKDEDFLMNFQALKVTLTDGLKLMNRIVAVKEGTKKNGWEVDGITGATISSRAIGSILERSTATWIPRLYKHQEVFKSNKNE